MIVAAAASPLPPDRVLTFLIQLTVLLALALVLGRLAARIGLAPILGELLAGLLAGPSLLGWALPGVSAAVFPTDPGQAHLLEAVGLVAVVLLVGVTGAHLDSRVLRERAPAVARISLGGLIVPLVLGVGVGLLAPVALLGGPGADRATFALFLGVAMCVSAIPVIAKTLMDLNLIHRDVGQLTLAAATIDDAVGWFLLSLVSAMAMTGLTAGTAGLAVLKLTGFVAVAVFAGRPAVRLLMRRVSGTGDPGPSLAAAVVVVFTGAMAAQALGLEAVFGGFVAGVLLGAPGVVDPVRLAPLRSVVRTVLAPLFMATVGLKVNLTELADPAVLATGAVILVVAVAGKFGGVYAGARLSRLGRWQSVALGAGLNARGVVEIVVASVGLRLGVLTTATYTIVVLVAVATSVMAPPLLRWSMARVQLTPGERRRGAEYAWTPVPIKEGSTP